MEAPFFVFSKAGFFVIFFQFFDFFDSCLQLELPSEHNPWGEKNSGNACYTDLFFTLLTFFDEFCLIPWVFRKGFFFFFLVVDWRKWRDYMCIVGMLQIFYRGVTNLILFSFLKWKMAFFIKPKWYSYKK